MTELRVTVPDGAHPVMHVWGAMVPGIGGAAAAFSTAVYEQSTLDLRTFEAARLRIAQINGCLFCRDWRTERDGETVDDAFPNEVEAWATSTALSARERLAAEYAERYAVDHHNIDDTFWARLRAEFEERELVELSMCLGCWIGFGRLNRVFGLDEACTLPGH